MALNISIAGGDTRQFYMLHRLISKLNNKDYFIKYYQPGSRPLEFQILQNAYSHTFAVCSDMEELLADCHIFLGPAPFSRDGIHLFSSDANIRIPLNEFRKCRNLKYLFGGNIPKSVISEFSDNITEIYDFMKIEEFVQLNSELTAEGLLKDIIANTPVSINNSHILISGYGNCGKRIAEKLSALGGIIYIYDKFADVNLSAQEQGYTSINIHQEQSSLPSFDFVVNTVPALIYETPFLRKLRKSCVLFEVASSPGGFDENICQGLSLKLVSCPGIPGKTAPKTAGYAMADCILAKLEI